jgi:hypothetical protein
MDVGAGRNDFVQHKFIHFHLMQKSFSHRVQCIGWPTKKPIDGAAIHQRWKFSQSFTKRIADGTEGENNMQIVFRSCNAVWERDQVEVE